MYFKHLIQLATLFLVAESLEEDEVEYIRCTLGALYYKNKVTLPDSQHESTSCEFSFHFQETEEGQCKPVALKVDVQKASVMSNCELMEKKLICICNDSHNCNSNLSAIYSIWAGVAEREKVAECALGWLKETYDFPPAPITTESPTTLPSSPSSRNNNRKLLLLIGSLVIFLVLLVLGVLATIYRKLIWRHIIRLYRVIKAHLL